MPYPNHVKEMINTVSSQIKKQTPGINYPIYKGFEITPNIDLRLANEPNNPTRHKHFKKTQNLRSNMQDGSNTRKANNK